MNTQTPTRETKNGPWRLPTFKGYTVDARLREFRKIPADPDSDLYDLEFIDWRSDEGDALLVELLKNPQLICTYNGESIDDVLDEIMRKAI